MAFLGAWKAVDWPRNRFLCRDAVIRKARCIICFVPYNRMSYMAKEFIFKYQKELNEMWETGQYRKLPPLV